MGRYEYFKGLIITCTSIIWAYIFKNKSQNVLEHIIDYSAPILFNSFNYLNDNYECM